jgi:pyridoxal phosphate enzyme (YggS family)
MPDLARRFIGHLQSNKVKKCLELFDTIDSVDSVKLLKRISNTALQQERTIHVLLEINTSGETQKHGFLPDQLNDISECFNIPNINIEGLMTVGPFTRDKEKIRDSFIQLRALRTRIKQSVIQSDMMELSMGMSGDYEIAVEEGSTMIRLGTALFGRRTPL